MKKFFATTIIAATLAACSSTDPVRDEEYKLRNATAPIITKASSPEEQIRYNKVRYLYRFLLDNDEKGRLYEELALEENWPQKHEDLKGNMSTIAGSVIGLGNMGALSMAFDAADLLLSNDIEYASFVAVPEELNGINYTSKDVTQQLVREQFKNSVINALNNAGYKTEQFSVTPDKNTEVLIAKLTSATTGLALKPEELIVRLSTGKAIEYKSNGPLDEALLGYKNKYNVSANIELFTKAMKDENNQFLTSSLGEGDKSYVIPKAQKRVTNTALNRALYRDISKSIPWYYASEKHNEDYIVYDGVVYQWFNNSAKNLITRIHTK